MSFSMKTIVQALGAVLVAVVPPLLVGPLGFPEIINVIVIGIGAFLVWNTKNYPNWRYGKLLASVAAAVTAGLVALATKYVYGDVSTQQWSQLLLAFITAVAVWWVRNPGYVYTEAPGTGAAAAEGGPRAL